MSWECIISCYHFKLYNYHVNGNNSPFGLANIWQWKWLTVIFKQNYWRDIHNRSVSPVYREPINGVLVWTAGASFTYMV